VTGIRLLESGDISEDGTIAEARANLGPDEFVSFVWREGIGVAMLETMLRDEFGLAASIDGWQLGNIGNFSDDGLVMTGGGINPQGFSEPWIAILDPPATRGDFNNDGRADITDVDRLIAALRTHSYGWRRYDLDDTKTVESGDLTQLIQGVLYTWFGDANLDGQFNTNDLVAVFQGGQYEDGTKGNSTWATGDWNGDGDFTSRDLVMAFQDGGYERGPRAATVPESSSGLLISIAGLLVTRCRKTANMRKPVVGYLINSEYPACSKW
jgi:hypothetical protein